MIIDMPRHYKAYNVTLLDFCCKWRAIRPLPWKVVVGKLLRVGLKVSVHREQLVFRNVSVTAVSNLHTSNLVWRKCTVCPLVCPTLSSTY